VPESTDAEAECRHRYERAKSGRSVSASGLMHIRIACTLRRLSAQNAKHLKRMRYRGTAICQNPPIAQRCGCNSCAILMKHDIVRCLTLNNYFGLQGRAASIWGLASCRFT